jgi:hypothetical protein
MEQEVISCTIKEKPHLSRMSFLTNNTIFRSVKYEDLHNLNEERSG